MKLPKFKPTAAFLDNFSYYYGNGQSITNVLPYSVMDAEAVEPDYWFWLLDTHGIRVNCTQPIVASKIIEAKGRANLTVKMWAEDMANGDVLFWWELDSWPVLEWMKRAARRQAGKILQQRNGFAPSWTRA